LETGPPYWQHQADLVEESLVGVSAPLMLIGHSGGGPLLGLIGRHLGRPIAGYVFVDAALPAGNRSWLQTAPPGAAAHIRSTARNGWVPPWHEWFDEKDLVAEIPDNDQRTRFVAGLEPLPFEMFEELRPEAPDWPDAPCSYLQLSVAYENEARIARERGWPTISADLSHLAPLTRPENVAADLLRLIDS